MGFMQEQITARKKWYKVDGDNGTEFVPADSFTKPDAKSIYSGKVTSVETVYGYGARMSASGYLDCTEWAVFNTESLAKAFLAEMYGEDE